MIDLTAVAARRLYTAGNNQGLGYAPYTDVPGTFTVDAAVAAAEFDGWTVVLDRSTTSDVVVLRDGDGAVLAIGGDALGREPWAVPLIDNGRPCASGVELDGTLVGDEGR